MTMIRSLTLKEKNVLEFLQAFIKDNGIAPTYQEICQHFGFASFNSVQKYLKQLETKRYIHIPGGNQKRAITILQSADAMQTHVEDLAVKDRTSAAASVSNVVPMVARAKERTANDFSIPLLGRVAAGLPLEAHEYDEYIDVPPSLVRQPEKTYALRVQGQSMIEDGIFDGDVILVQRESRAQNGEIVVAVVGEEATVKRFYAHDEPYEDESEVSELEGTSYDDDLWARRSHKHIELRPANSTMSSFWYEPHEVQIRGVVVGLIRRFF